MSGSIFYMLTMPKYILHPDGVTGYYFDPMTNEVHARRNGVETVVEAGTEAMGRANDARTGHTLGYGAGEEGREITEEEYKRL